MNSNEKDDSINPDDLPEENFRKKEIFQHPQPADQGLPLDKDGDYDKRPATNGKPEEKTGKEEGLNEEKSAGSAGAFEGFEDHGSRKD
jgi:hypothetical protein